MPSTFNYSNGDGHTVLDSATPVGATDPVSILDQSDQQIKKFIKDDVAGLAKILGPTGQMYTLRFGTSNPTPVSGEGYLFYRTDTGVLSLVSNGTLIPFIPGAGAVAGKVLFSGGLASVATWGKMIPSRNIVEVHSAFSVGSVTDNALVGVTVASPVSVSGGKLVLATGYTYVIRGMVNAAVDLYPGSYIQLYNDTSASVLQYGMQCSGVTFGRQLVSSFDATLENSSGSPITIALKVNVATSSTALSGVSSTHPAGRLVIEVHPN